MQPPHPLVAYLLQGLHAQANPADAAAMQAYMKTEQPFYGVKSTPRRALLRRARQAHPITSRDEYETVIRALWTGKTREENYLALDVAESVRAFHDVASWPLYAEIVYGAPWWDTLDWVAGKIAGPLVITYRELEQELIRWRKAERMWVRRASLLAHLKHKDATNTELLAETILLLAPEQEFFIRKAIGWVLREYGKSNPEWVRAFVAAHSDGLAPLSRREALKNIGTD